MNTLASAVNDAALSVACNINIIQDAKHISEKDVSLSILESEYWALLYYQRLSYQRSS